MPQQVYEDTANYTIEWDSDLGAVIHTWTGFTSGEEFRAGCEALLDAIKAKNASYLIVDTRNVKAHDDEDKQWLQEEWTPRMVDAGVEGSAQVHPDSVISKMEMENLAEDMDDIPFENFLTDSMDEARDWVASQ